MGLYGGKKRKLAHGQAAGNISRQSLDWLTESPNKGYHSRTLKCHLRRHKWTRPGLMEFIAIVGRRLEDLEGCRTRRKSCSHKTTSYYSTKGKKQQRPSQRMHHLVIEGENATTPTLCIHDIFVINFFNFQWFLYIMMYSFYHWALAKAQQFAIVTTEKKPIPHA